MTPEGFEPPAFGFGIQRAAVAPWAHGIVRNVAAKEYTRPGSNRGPLACEASVITN